MEQDFPGTSVIWFTADYYFTLGILSASLPLISRGPGGEHRPAAIRSYGDPVRLVTTEASLPESIPIIEEINHVIGSIDMLDARSQAPGLWDAGRSSSDVAILHHTDHRTRLLEQCLQKEGIPYVVTGREDYLDYSVVQGTISFFGALFKQSGVDGDTLAFCKKCTSPSADYSSPVERLLSRPRKDKPWKLSGNWIPYLGLGANKSIDAFVRMSYFHETIEDMLSALAFGQTHGLKRNGQDSCPSGVVTLMTFYTLKGLEFPTVLLHSLKQGILPLKTGGGPTNPYEERRLMYVGMTKAKNELTLTTSEESPPFLEELPEDACRDEKAQAPSNGMKQLSLLDFT